MKTPSFWYLAQNEKPPLGSDLLLPFSFLFKCGSALRKFFARPYRTRVPLICVGNAVAGGAGKTPTCLELARLLKTRGHKPCFVTRGYGGDGRVMGVNLMRHQVKDVGDEALLLAAHAPVWAGRDRVEAVRQAESYGSVVIMDDGLQNPHLAPHLSLLVLDGASGIGNGRLVPAGPLREEFADAVNKADAIILIGEDRHALTMQIKIPILRARIEAELPLGFPRESRFVAFAGLARPEKFFATVQELGLDLAEACAYPDHHLFTEADIEDLRLKAEENGARLLTTEKDAVRLPPEFRAEIIILPIRLVFEGAGAEDALVELIKQKSI